MQWLIDLIIERIGIPPVYIDRGDPPDFDFTTGNFTKDMSWHDLDLSGIVPAGAQAVLLNVEAQTIAAGHFFYLRKNGNSYNRTASLIYTQIANLAIGTDTIIALPSNRIIEYIASITTWTTLNMAVKGWWL